MSSHFLSSGFIFGEVPKISDVCHVLCEVLFMLDVIHSQVDVEAEFGVVSLDSVSLSILASIKRYLAFFKFLETVKDDLLLSDILPSVV